MNKIIAFHIQLIDATIFSEALGIPQIETPVDAESYSNSKLPFFKYYQQPSGIAGKFDGIKSVAEMDDELGARHTYHRKEKDLEFETVEIEDE